SDLENAVFDMVVAGRIAGDDVAIMMVEAEATVKTIDLIGSGASAPTEEIVGQGLEASKPFIRQLCQAQIELAKVAAKPTAEFPVFLDYQDDAFAAVEKAAKKELDAALKISGKQERETEIERLSTEVKQSLAESFVGREKEIPAAFRSLTKKLVRQRVLREKVRIDGRGLRDIRPLIAEVEVVPRVHGSAIFERGETQILGITTLNMLKIALIAITSYI
ncbi:MAG: polyribonucleotide nucleotidyltransferase, partial [Actinobacteria bacterium]|nr:polyribonucleotide nucleotidyltransferase [Actinomycetota bacterium]